ncbi:type VI protein secretion system component VasK [Natronocella acetinitrilica]|uniref:Type VI protein secretion system component VasK n=1 Tax=Natronocella acetinitrilica TaxID=414046 RepID=A0AAE3KDS0_9GAMM|nr:hypothetical protein [Natronocella acetinitrilica]MCP1677196.1 type VI protein secretion system component VasK [Natronocella acetinitrilica]
MIPGWTHPVHLFAGLVIWSIWFVTIYGGLSVGCAFAPPAPAAGPVTWINGLLLLLTLLVTALLAWAAWRCWQVTAVDGEHRFVVRVSLSVYLVSAVSTLAVGLPVMVYPPCV